MHLQLSFPVNTHTDAPAYRVHDGTDDHQSAEERRKLSDMYRRPFSLAQRVQEFS